LISELYGRRRANFLVTVGLGLNGFILACLWLGNALPSVAADTQAPWQTIQLAEAIALPNGDRVNGSIELFQLIYACTSGAVVASMLAYIAAQYCDVQLYHYLKKMTGGRHLWLRNNLSTLTSQLVDSLMVISVTFGAAFLDGRMTMAALGVLVASNYAFKMLAALVDTLPLYGLVHFLRRYLALPPGSVDLDGHAQKTHDLA
ncbi:MAG: queuosine precursor transporter, partial [Pseudomonadota bacterium]